nr:unnamed protein product [Digitaria exilis]
MDAPGELQCVGRLEVAAPPPARYLRVGSLPVPTDSSASLPALLPSPSPTGAPRYQKLPLETDLNTLPMIPNIPEKVFPNDAKNTEGSRYDGGLVNQNLSRKCEALAVSGLAEYGEGIDVIAPADILKQVTPLNWLEAWLDNIMASVPELAICYHQNGVVQGYELLKNDDIFLLKVVSDDGTPAFHPQVVQQNGLAVLKFLQDNCKQDPGAYWLYKGAEEDVIQLYDLSILPEKHKAGDPRSSCGPMSSFINKGRKESLFSLGTLLYRVAHRMSLSKVPSNKAKCAKFFRKCLDFLSEQDHLVVRACAHEQFARLILKCYEELELTSESFMIESEVTLTDLDDDSPELRLENLPSKQNVLPEIGKDEPAASDSILECSPLVSSGTTDSLMEPSNVDDCSSSSVTKDDLSVDSLNTQDGCNDSTDTVLERSVDFSLCRCGDIDCIEVCDIREWLPKSKMDHKLWKLVLLLGESYLALGEAYKNDGQLQRALKVVELACLVYGSMPGHLDGDEFISSMSNISLGWEDVGLKTKLVLDEAGYCKNKCFSYEVSSQQSPPNYVFWAKAWMLVGDVYAEYHRLNGHQTKVVPEQKSHGEVRMSNEVALEVKRLKRKLGKDKQNCGTCSLINCSCQSDRASSGSSASSSSPEASTNYGRKKNRKSLGRNPQCQYKETNENPAAQEAVQGSEKKQHIVKDTCIENNSVSNDDVDHYNHAGEKQSRNVDDVPGKSHTHVPSVREGGIFKFLGGPKPGDIEYNLSSAIHCYGAAKEALFAYPVHSAETSTVLKKRGWAFNELGRCRLESRNLGSAEIAFADAIRAFQEMLETALVHLLEGRQVVEKNEDYSNDVDLDIKPKFWSQLQSLLKRMLAASLPSNTGRVASVGQAGPSNREAAKLKEMYRYRSNLPLWANCMRCTSFGYLEDLLHQ